MKDDTTINLFGETYMPKEWFDEIRGLAEELGVTQKAALGALSIVDLEWDNEMEEYIFSDDMDWGDGLEEEVCQVMNFGSDGSGGPETEELSVLNLIAVAYPAIPLNIAKQIRGSSLRGGPMYNILYAER